MGKKTSKSESEKAKQRERTRGNKKRKYEKLISNYPNDLQVPIWRKKLEQLL